MRPLRPSNQHHRTTAERLIIGLGNPLRGDDGIGPEVVRRLRRRLGGYPEVRLVESGGADLTELLVCEGCSRIIVIDAAWLRRKPGTWIRLPDATSTLRADPEAVGLGHGMGLAEAMTMLSLLGVRLPPVVVYAVQVGRLGWGEGLSPPVRRVAGRVADAVLQEATDPGRSGKVFASMQDVRACRQASTRSMEETGGVPWRRSL
jgi:hydrogenase maturation protease